MRNEASINLAYACHTHAQAPTYTHTVTHAHTNRAIQLMRKNCLYTNRAEMSDACGADRGTERKVKE